MRELPVQDREHLNNMFRGDIPECVIETYWDFKRYRDVLDGGKPLDSTELSLIAMFGVKIGKVTPPDPPEVVKLPFSELRQDHVGRMVTVKFRKKEVLAELVGLNLDSVLVKLDKESINRELPGDTIVGLVKAKRDPP